MQICTHTHTHTDNHMCVCTSKIKAIIECGRGREAGREVGRTRTHYESAQLRADAARSLSHSVSGCGMWHVAMQPVYAGHSDRAESQTHSLSLPRSPSLSLSLVHRYLV